MPRRSRLDDDIPKLPRGRGLALSFPQLLRIVTVAVALVGLVVLQKPCARSVSKFVTDFSPRDAAVTPDAQDAGPAIPQGIHIRSDMTPAEIEAAVARAKAEAGIVDAGAPALDAGSPGPPMN